MSRSPVVRNLDKLSHICVRQGPSQDSLKGGAELNVCGRDTKGAEIETPQASRGWGMGTGYPLRILIRGLEEGRELPQQGHGRSPAEIEFDAS